jgi:phage repressor protein C with HTH and peptisase S24 domain
MQERTGIDNGNLSKIERGLTSLTNETMSILANALDISLPELFTDPRLAEEIASTISSSDATSRFVSVSEFEDISLIPEGANVAIGTLIARADPLSGRFVCSVDESRMHIFFGGDIAALEFSKPHSLAAIMVEDDMMAPCLFPTDTVVVDFEDRDIPTAGGIFAAILDNKRVTICRLAALPGRHVRVMYDNHAFDRMGIDMNEQQAAEMFVVGRVKHRRGNAGL